MSNKPIFDGKAPAAFQYMPPGESVICATVNGKPGKRRVVVDKAAAERLQADLVAKIAAAKAGEKARPCGLFDHKSGPASFIPTGFYWDDEHGVMCSCEWTDAGKQAVEGRNYTYFSPSFRLARDGRVMGLQDGVEVGSMVNNPAFETIEPIAAAKADEPADDVEDVNCGSAEEKEDDYTEAANPYGCNQYGHGFRQEHPGYGSGRQKTSSTSEKKEKDSAEKREREQPTGKGEDKPEANKKADSEIVEEGGHFKIKGENNFFRTREGAEDYLKKKKIVNEYGLKVVKVDKRGKYAYYLMPGEGKQVPESVKKQGEDLMNFILHTGKTVRTGANTYESTLRASKVALHEKLDKSRYTMNETLNRIIQKVRRAAAASEEVAAAVAEMPARVADEFEAVQAANPYGCNQHGHGYKQPHNGMQKGQKEGKPNKPGWSPRRDSRKVKAAEPEGMEDDDNAEDKRKQYEDELEKLRAACEHEQDKDKKAVLKKRLEEMEAANPYGCNQYGHGFKREHSGYGGGGQKTFSFGETKEKKQPRKSEDLNEIEKRRKELVRRYRKNK